MKPRHDAADGGAAASEAHVGSALPWFRLSGKTIVDVYAHDVEPEAGGGTLFWYDCTDGDSVPIFSPHGADERGAY